MTRSDRPTRSWAATPVPALLYVLIALGIPLIVLVSHSLRDPDDGSLALSGYEMALQEEVYLRSLGRTLVLVALASALTVALATPVAYHVGLHVEPRRRIRWIAAVVLAFSSSSLLRVFAWRNLLGDRGVINEALSEIGLITEPLPLANDGRWAVASTFVYLAFPLAFLLIVLSMQRVDPDTIDAARDLGASPWRVLTALVLPVARPGLFAAFAACFVTMLGDYATPTLVGGTEGATFITLVVTKFGFSEQWDLGSALAILLLLAMIVLLATSGSSLLRTSRVAPASTAFRHRSSRILQLFSLLILGLVYAPLALMFALSFNDSPTLGLPMRGVTLRWVGGVWANGYLADAARSSLVVAGWAVPIGVMLGTSAGIYLARHGGRWRTVQLGIIALPACVPPVMVGLGALVALQSISADRGRWTIVLAHVLLIVPVATLMVAARLEGLDPEAEMAAVDLGARPVQALLFVTLPQAAPAIAAAALVSVSISFDEFFLTFLVTGNEVTLPLFLYGGLRYSPTPQLNVIASLMFLGSLALCGLAGLTAQASGRLSRPAPTRSG